MTGVQINAVLQLVVDALLSDATVQGLVGNRVRGGWERSSDEQTVSLPRIAVEIDPGGRQAYGGSPATLIASVAALSDVGLDECYSIWEAARDALHAEALCHATNGHRGTATVAQLPHGGWSRDAGCWMAVGRFTLVVVR